MSLVKNHVGEIVDKTTGEIIEEPVFYGPRRIQYRDEIKYESGATLFIDLPDHGRRIYMATREIVQEYIAVTPGVEHFIARLVKHVLEERGWRGSPWRRLWSRVLAYIVVKNYAPHKTKAFLKKHGVKHLLAHIQALGLSKYIKQSIWDTVYKVLDELIASLGVEELRPLAQLFYMEARKKVNPTGRPSCMAGAILRLATYITGLNEEITQEKIAKQLGSSDAGIRANEQLLCSHLGITIHKTGGYAPWKIELPEDLFQKVMEIMKTLEEVIE